MAQEPTGKELPAQNRYNYGGTGSALCVQNAAIRVAGAKDSAGATVVPPPAGEQPFGGTGHKQGGENPIQPAGAEGSAGAAVLLPAVKGLEPFTGAEHRQGGENLLFCPQYATILVEHGGHSARTGVPPELPAPDRPKVVTAADDSGFQVHVTEVAPQGMEQVLKHAEAGWNRDVTTAGETARVPLETRVPLEKVPEQFLHEVARWTTNLQGHHGVVRLQLQLDPPQLGSVAVQLTLSEQKLKVHFYTTDDEVKDLLVTTLPDLKTELGRMGLNLNEAYVFVGQEHSREPQQPPRWEGGFSAPDSPVETADEIILAAEGVDLLV
ncbi:MAG: flagellar hook-length control protein FliK [Bacillota bacterium]